MGFVLSLLYLVTYYLTPDTIFGSLAEYRVELILAVLVFVVSLPALTKSFILKTPQSLALIGLMLAVVLSVIFGQRSLGRSVPAFQDTMPLLLAYFLVCLHCNSMKKLKALVLMLLCVCLFVIAHGALDLLHGVPESAPMQPGQDDSVERDAIDLWNIEHPYLYATRDNAGNLLCRLRGLGLINDPNDFGQLAVCVVPLMFIFWRPKKIVRNLGCVIIPACVLIFGIFLTHSRGALLALMAMAVVAARRRIGTLPAMLVAGALFASAMALHFTGGREISASAGADRTVLWGEGLQILKAHPLFGVGLDNMPDYTEEHLTAHNSLIVCAVELGLFGLYFWSMFLFSTVRDALVAASPAKVSEGQPIISEERPFPQASRKIEEVDKAQVNNQARYLILSLTGFLVAGWFLSRAFVATLYLLGGMVEVVYEIASRRGMIAPRLGLRRTLLYAGGLAIALILLMYAMLRTVNLMH
jgi:O-antigen ligase